MSLLVAGAGARVYVPLQYRYSTSINVWNREETEPTIPRSVTSAKAAAGVRSHIHELDRAA
jgi:hypothetical protein